MKTTTVTYGSQHQSGVYRFNRNDNTFFRMNTPILSQSIAFTDLFFDHYGNYGCEV